MKILYIIIAILLTTLISCKPGVVPPPENDTDYFKVIIYLDAFSIDSAIGYRVYHSYDKDMKDKVCHTLCSNPVKVESTSIQPLTGFSITCNDVPIQPGHRLYVTVSIITPKGEYESQPFGVQH